MLPKILVTGVTGYIGGDAFHALHEAHPDFDYTLLVRSKDREEQVRKKYLNADNIRIIHPGNGSLALSLTDILQEEAGKADIVLHTAGFADDVPQATAILKGLQTSGRPADNPAFWIHISGTGILQWYDQTHNRHGQPPLPSEKYDDLADINRILTLPDQANHRDVDKIVLSANNSNNNGAIKTAIVAPPTIYGFGRGPLNTISQQIPSLTRFILAHGYAPIVGTGKTEWDHIHIHDVSSLVVSLIDAVLDPTFRENPEVFGERAYYFCESGTHVWGEVAAKIGAEAVKQGLLKEVMSKEVQEGDVAGETWGANSKCVASRARKYLGWEPQGPKFEEEFPGIVEFEGKRMGCKKIP
ncbi:NAD-dependent epimerase/dehydratase domain-containing protein [Madurella fahalii]|uniref:NAD-dependent epimerase/dehydratase domain-containing protein n=1 Tax=Madurella fahalii TaxID=1157608 RepID=A0ABQ0FYH7_9PEZI